MMRNLMPDEWRTTQSFERQNGRTSQTGLHVPVGDIKIVRFGLLVFHDHVCTTSTHFLRRFRAACTPSSSSTVSGSKSTKWERNFDASKNCVLLTVCSHSFFPFAFPDYYRTDCSFQRRRFWVCVDDELNELNDDLIMWMYLFVVKWKLTCGRWRRCLTTNEYTAIEVSWERTMIDQHDNWLALLWMNEWMDEWSVPSDAMQCNECVILCGRRLFLLRLFL